MAALKALEGEASNGATVSTAYPDEEAYLLAYRRECDDDQRTVLVNFRDQPARFDPGERLEIEVASDGAHEGEPFSGDVRARQALILGRAARTSAG